jgi:hypothetical protein
MPVQGKEMLTSNSVEDKQATMGPELDLALTLHVEGSAGGQQKKGRRQEREGEKDAKKKEDNTPKGGKMVSTGHGKAGNQARSFVWSRQQQ